MMDACEKILGIMKRMGEAENRYLKRAKMLDSTRCKVGDLELGREDYLKPEGVELKKGDTVVVYRLDKETYVILAKVV